MERTTGQIVSRFGVLTVLTNNLLSENHLDSTTRRAHRKEIVKTINGGGGINPGKLQQRSLERCVNGVWN